MNEWRTHVGRVGLILAGVYLILVALTLLVALAIPGWFLGIVAFFAGILLLVGR